MSMNLDEAQKQKVRGWIDSGLKLSEIQNKLTSELGLKLTYMEVRFLMDDLKLKPKDAEPPKTAVKEIKPETSSQPPASEPNEDFDDLPAATGAGKVSVSVDQVARPGAVVSGKVTFSDGKSAEWYLDQFGRLGVAPQEKGYKPSQADVAAFQAELQNELARMGF